MPGGVANISKCHLLQFVFINYDFLVHPLQGTLNTMVWLEGMEMTNAHSMFGYVIGMRLNTLIL